jgi:DNA-binding SARP family transcriptional activator
MIIYRVLGPLEVSADGRVIEIRSPKMRALLVSLLLRANESVPRDVLLHELWGEQPPAGAQHSLDVYVSRLRKSLDAAADGPVVLSRPDGYSLQLADGQLDARRFEQLVEEGRAALAGNAPDQAAATLRAALELWRGHALADLADGLGPRGEAARLEELRLRAIEDRIDSDLALGRHADVVSELAGLVAVHPLRERLCGQLMTALCRSGRQADDDRNAAVRWWSEYWKWLVWCVASMYLVGYYIVHLFIIAEPPFPYPEMPLRGLVYSDTFPLVRIAVIAVVLALIYLWVAFADRSWILKAFHLILVVVWLVFSFSLVYYEDGNTQASDGSFSAFGHPLSKNEALYFTVGILTTAGTGDLSPQSDPVREAVTVQMSLDVVVLVIGIAGVVRESPRAARPRGSRGSAGPGMR